MKNKKKPYILQPDDPWSSEILSNKKHNQNSYENPPSAQELPKAAPGRVAGRNRLRQLNLFNIMDSIHEETTGIEIHTKP